MRVFCFLLAFIAMLSSCKGHVEPQFVHKEVNSVYYWKTVFSPDSADFAFIREHDIGRIYLRMFDVSLDSPDPYSDGDRSVPNASVSIPSDTYYIMADSLKNVQFVPVVYITLDALKENAGKESRLAGKIVKRVKNMCSYNGIINVEGLQLDCDWTKSTEQSFFALCKSLRAEIEKNKLQWNMSSTIRLHQLSGKVPPVDYGVLMVYNTGNFNNPDTRNSIIDEADIKPYLKYLDDYSLHLDIAYPTYSWQLLFRNRQFIGLLNGVNVSDTTKFIAKSSNVSMALRDFPYNEIIIRNGDLIRTESSLVNEVLNVKSLIDGELNSRKYSNIIYHFDLKNLSKYSKNEIDSIFS